jgi:hypothetical protein
MLSKVLPWDFLQKFPVTMDPKFEGPQAFLIDEPYIERVFLDRLPKKENKFALYTGNELTRDFIEEHFINLSFFSENDPILVMNAETIPNGMLDFILETDIDWSTRKLLLFFTKSNKSFTEFAKNKKVHAVEMDMPRFWEGPKMWQFCMKAREVNLDSAVTRFALENLEHNFESFFGLIDTVKVHFPDGKVDLNFLKELIARERFDFFELVDLFHRNPKLFFQEVLKKEMDFDWLRTLSSFMQTHLIKILFPQEILAKGKPSKYEQGVLDVSEKLNREMVKSYLDFFSELEVRSKAHDPFVIEKLKLEVLK